MNLSYSHDAPEEEVGFWELKRGEVTLAMLEQCCLDFPWVDCFFFPEPEFEPYRNFFERAGEEWHGRVQELHELIAREDIHLFAHGGHRLKAFTLVVDGAEARLTFTEV